MFSCMAVNNYWGGGGGGVEILKFHCFVTHFTSIKCILGITEEGSIYFLKAPRGKFRNQCVKAILVGVLEIFGTKV